jgi:hypothetical protein
MLDKNKNFLGFISSNGIIGKVQLFIGRNIVSLPIVKKDIAI